MLMKQTEEVAELVAACTCVVDVRRGIVDVVQVHDIRRRRQEGVVVACGHYSSSTAIASANKSLLGDCTSLFCFDDHEQNLLTTSFSALSPIIFRFISLSMTTYYYTGFVVIVMVKSENWSSNDLPMRVCMCHISCHCDLRFDIFIFLLFH